MIAVLTLALFGAALAGKPPPVKNVIVMVSNRDKVRLIWDRVTFGDQPTYLSYELKMEKNGHIADSNIFSVSTPLITLQNLEPGAHYRFHVSAKYDREISDPVIKSLTMPRANDEIITATNLRLANKAQARSKILRWHVPMSQRTDIKGYTVHYAYHPNLVNWTHVRVPGNVPKLSVYLKAPNNPDYMFIIQTHFRGGMPSTSSEKFIYKNVAPNLITHLDLKDATPPYGGRFTWKYNPSINPRDLSAVLFMLKSSTNLAATNPNSDRRNDREQWENFWLYDRENIEKGFIDLPAKLEKTKDLYVKIRAQKRGARPNEFLPNDNQVFKFKGKSSR